MIPHHVVSLSNSTTPSTTEYASSTTSSRASSPRSSQIDQSILLDHPSRLSSEEGTTDLRRSSYSDSYDSSAEGGNGGGGRDGTTASVSSSVRRGGYASAHPHLDATTPTSSLTSDNLAVDRSHLPPWSGDESHYSSRVSSRAASPAPGSGGLGLQDGFDGYLSYRAAGSRSAARSRNVSGFSTPTTPAEDHSKETYGPDLDYDAHHHQTSALLHKLSGAFSTPDTSPVMGRKQRKPGWWTRRAESRRKNTLSFSSSSSNAPLLGSPSGHHSSKSHHHHRRDRNEPSSASRIVRILQAILRQPYVPTQPLTILFSILLFLCFAATLTTFLMNVLSSDREPLPWRQFCQEQRPFPHDLADSLKPVNVFVGVFSVDAAIERRNAIRMSYAKHSKPIDPRTGRPGTNVQLKFILGKPRSSWSKRIALEMEMFNDLVVLDVGENMNKGKTFKFFEWANENATVPVYYTKSSAGGQEEVGTMKEVSVGFKKVDYVVKADDDAFIVLSELERHLRITPRENTYWGYLIRNRFMGGEVYAVSSDLVNYLATYSRPSSWMIGKEDQRVAKWMRNHPNASSIHWITERCYIYDHPKAGTTYSRGFTFPDHVEQVRLEGRRGISEEERLRRGGELWQSYSTVQSWRKPYQVPANGLSIEEQVEALVEGGGRWSGQGWRSDNGRGPQAVKYDGVVFSKNDERLIDRVGGGTGQRDRPDSTKTGVKPGVPDMNELLPSARTTRFGKDLFRDPQGVEAVHLRRKRSAEGGVQEGPTRAPLGEGEYEIYNLARGPFEEEGFHSTQFVNPAAAAGTTSRRGGNNTSFSSPSSPLSKSATPHHTAASEDDQERVPPVNEPTGQIRLGHHAYTVPYTEERFIPAPTLRYDSQTLSVRSQRMLGLPHGGTVAVHYLKRNEWFYETALALLGREKMWDHGFDTPAYPLSPSTSPFTSSSYSLDSYSLSATPSPVPENTRGGGFKVESLPALWGSVRMYGSPIVLDDGMIVEGRRAEANREVLVGAAGGSRPLPVNVGGSNGGWGGRIARVTGGGRTMGMMNLAEMEGVEFKVGHHEEEKEEAVDERIEEVVSEIVEEEGQPIPSSSASQTDTVESPLSTEP